MRKAKWTSIVYFIAPDGTIREFARIEDVLGECKGTFSVSDDEKEKFVNMIKEGASDRISAYYDGDGNFIG